MDYSISEDIRSWASEFSCPFFSFLLVFLQFKFIYVIMSSFRRPELQAWVLSLWKWEMSKTDLESLSRKGA